MFGAGLPTPPKRATAGLLFPFDQWPNSEEETCGRPVCGVRRPAHNIASSYDNSARTVSSSFLVRLIPSTSLCLLPSYSTPIQLR